MNKIILYVALLFLCLSYVRASLWNRIHKSSSRYTPRGIQDDIRLTTLGTYYRYDDPADDLDSLTASDCFSESSNTIDGCSISNLVNAHSMPNLRAVAKIPGVRRAVSDSTIDSVTPKLVCEPAYSWHKLNEPTQTDCIENMSCAPCSAEEKSSSEMICTKGITPTISSTHIVGAPRAPSGVLGRLKTIIIGRPRKSNALSAITSPTRQLGRTQSLRPQPSHTRPRGVPQGEILPHGQALKETDGHTVESTTQSDSVGSVPHSIATQWNLHHRANSETANSGASSSSVLDKVVRAIKGRPRKNPRAERLDTHSSTNTLSECSSIFDTNTLSGSSSSFGTKTLSECSGSFDNRMSGPYDVSKNPSERYSTITTHSNNVELISCDVRSVDTGESRQQLHNRRSKTPQMPSTSRAQIIPVKSAISGMRRGSSPVIATKYVKKNDANNS